MLFLLDLDGTLTKHGTNDLLEGSLKLVKKIADDGHQIVFVTKRGSENYSYHHKYGEKSTKELIHAICSATGITPLGIIMNADSPRIVVNDSGAIAVGRDTNQPWSDEDIDFLLKGNKTR